MFLSLTFSDRHIVILLEFSFCNFSANTNTGDDVVFHLLSALQASASKENNVQSQSLKAEDPNRVSWLGFSSSTWIITRPTVRFFFSFSKFILFNVSERNHHTKLIMSFPNVSDLYICRVMYVCISVYTLKENEVSRHQLFKSQVFLNAADPSQKRKNQRRVDLRAPRIWFYSSLTLLILPPSRGRIIPDKGLERLVLVSTVIFQSYLIHLDLFCQTLQSRLKLPSERRLVLSILSLYLIPNLFWKPCNLIWGHQLEVGAISVTGQGSKKC